MSANALLTLLIDAGNTRAKFGWVDSATGQRESQIQTLEYDRVRELGPRMAALGARPQRILAANVAGSEIGRALEATCLHQFGRPIEWLDARHGRDMLSNRYQNTTELGADRWIGLIGLLHRVRRQRDWALGVPMLLATFGTATTLDTITRRISDDGSPQACFLGGLILPGPLLMARALADNTAHLPLADGTPTDYPTNTHNAISSGIAAAQAGALLRQWRTGLQSIGASAPQVFVSGGGWPLVRAEIEHGLARAQSDLGLPCQAAQPLASPVLDGLACLASGHRDSAINRLI